MYKKKTIFTLFIIKLICPHPEITRWLKKKSIVNLRQKIVLEFCILQRGRHTTNFLQ